MKIYDRFADRLEAAEALASRLQEYRGKKPLILSIPRGAVPMGKVLAERLQGEHDAVLAHKLCAPFDPEYAIGAIDESGWTYLAPAARELGEDFIPIKREKARQLNELKRKRALYTPGRPSLDPHDRIVIVIDDGMATGSTMIAALHAVAAKKPAKLICAVPVAPPETVEYVGALADKIVCLLTPENFLGVGQFYRHFPQVEDNEVAAILVQSARHDSAADLHSARSNAGAQRNGHAQSP